MHTYNNIHTNIEIITVHTIHKYIVNSVKLLDLSPGGQHVMIAVPLHLLLLSCVQV